LGIGKEKRKRTKEGKRKGEGKKREGREKKGVSAILSPTTWQT